MLRMRVVLVPVVKDGFRAFGKMILFELYRTPWIVLREGDDPQAVSIEMDQYHKRGVTGARASIHRCNPC